MIPLRRQRKVIALFVALQTTVKALPDLKILTDELAQSEPAFVSTYYEPRVDLAVLPSDLHDHDLSSFIESHIAQAGRNRSRLLCLRFSYAELLRHGIDEDSYADPDHATDDLLRLVYTFVEPSGSILSLDTETLLLCYSARHISDARFLLDHIRTLLEKFYPSIRPLSLPMLGSVTCPEDASDSRTVLAGLGIPSDT